MQQKMPFLFSMPPLFAWPLAITTSIALLLAVYLVFTEPAVADEGEVEAPAEVAGSAESSEEGPAEGQVLSSTGQIVHISLLVLSVGLIPLMARRKGMKATWWVIGGLGAGSMFVMMRGLPLFHPLMVLLALVYLRPQPPVAPAAVPDVRSSGVEETEPAVEVLSDQGSTPPVRRRPPRRRRRPRF